MGYSVEIAKAIIDFLNEEQWGFNFDEEEGVFSLQAELGCKLGKSDVLIRVGEDYFITYAGVSLRADAECRQAVAEYICRANYGMRNGNFELDFADGEIRYKSYNNCDGIVPSKEIIADGVILPAVMVDKYGNGLVAVMFGIQTPEDAIAASEAQS